MEIGVLIDEGFEECVDVAWLKNLAERALVFQGVSSNAELGLVIASQERVRQLNRDYLGKDEPTDVIAFSMLPEAGFSPFVTPPDGVLHLGEAIISYPQAATQAEERRHSVRREVAILIIHGILHLLGYEDGTPESRRMMTTREAEILSYIEKKTPLSLS